MVRKYYSELPDIMDEKKRKQEDIEEKIKELHDASTTIPSLL